jgi:hypothetical protein
VTLTQPCPTPTCSQVTSDAPPESEHFTRSGVRHYHPVKAHASHRAQGTALPLGCGEAVNPGESGRPPIILNRSASAIREGMPPACLSQPGRWPDTPIVGFSVSSLLHRCTWLSTPLAWAYVSREGELSTACYVKFRLSTGRAVWYT